MFSKPYQFAGLLPSGSKNDGAERVGQETRVSYPIQQGEEWLLVCGLSPLAFQSIHFLAVVPIK